MIWNLNGIKNFKTSGRKASHNQQPRRRASGYVVLIRWLQSGFNTLYHDAERRGIKPSARINLAIKGRVLRAAALSGSFEDRRGYRGGKKSFIRKSVFPPLIDDEEVRNMLAQESPMMRKANATIEIMEMSPKEKWLYENRMKYEHDKASWKHEGYQEGLDKGSYQKAIETAAAFKRMGIDIEKIAEGTGLSKEEVEKL